MTALTVPVRDRARTRAGVALVEVLVGLVIVGLVVSATAASLSRLSDAKRRSSARHQATSRADDAAARIARDLGSTLRDADLSRCRVQITQGLGVPGFERDGLLIITRSARSQRPMVETPEGGEYEVQYRVDFSDNLDGGTVLWRRADHAMDPYQDAGGIAVALGPCAGLSVEAYDGTDWFEQWDSDDDGLPHAVRVVVTGASDDGSSTFQARRTVAIDRVPIPPEADDETEATSEAAPATTGGSR